MQVRVYRNLNRKCWSVQTKTNKGWRVSYHLHLLKILNPIFIVNEKGRQRVIREQKKNVHAFIQGEFDEGFINHVEFEHMKITYNPYRDKFFNWNGTGIKVGDSISQVYLTETGVYL